MIQETWRRLKRAPSILGWCLGIGVLIVSLNQAPSLAVLTLLLQVFFLGGAAQLIHDPFRSFLPAAIQALPRAFVLSSLPFLLVAVIFSLFDSGPLGWPQAVFRFGLAANFGYFCLLAILSPEQRVLAAITETFALTRRRPVAVEAIGIGLIAGAWLFMLGFAWLYRSAAPQPPLKTLLPYLFVVLASPCICLALSFLAELRHRADEPPLEDALVGARILPPGGHRSAGVAEPLP